MEAETQYMFRHLVDFNNDGFFDPESPSENLILNFNGQISDTSNRRSTDVITFRSPSISHSRPVHLRILVADSTQEYFLVEPVNLRQTEKLKITK